MCMLWLDIFNKPHIESISATGFRVEFLSSNTVTMQYYSLFLSLPYTHSCVQVLPDVKQDSKDLTRDIVRINGKVLLGSIGYRNIYEELALELLPSRIKRCLANNLSACRCGPVAGDNTKNTEISTPRNFLVQKLPRNSSREREETQQTTTQQLGVISGDVHKEATLPIMKYEEELCIAEIQALMLLHLVSRTLSSGQCFEAVIEAFGSDAFSLVVSDASCSIIITLCVLQFYRVVDIQCV